MIDKKMYALDKWVRCKIWGCPVCPTDSLEDMATCITCKKTVVDEKLKNKHGNDRWYK